jgi:hypothetical protein
MIFFPAAAVDLALPVHWRRPPGGKEPLGDIGGYFDTGMTNSAPLPIESGQRCMIDFCRV